MNSVHVASDLNPYIFEAKTNTGILDCNTPCASHKTEAPLAVNGELTKRGTYSKSVFHINVLQSTPPETLAGNTRKLYFFRYTDSSS